MRHPIRGIPGSKPRVAPSIAQMLRAEEAQKRKKRKLRKGRRAT
jgi:hypothetical protein